MLCCTKVSFFPFIKIFFFFYTEIWVSNYLTLLHDRQNTNQPSAQLNQLSCTQLLAKVSNFCEQQRTALCCSLNFRLRATLKNLPRHQQLYQSKRLSFGSYRRLSGSTQPSTSQSPHSTRNSFCRLATSTHATCTSCCQGRDYIFLFS